MPTLPARLLTLAARRPIAAGLLCGLLLLAGGGGLYGLLGAQRLLLLLAATGALLLLFRHPWLGIVATFFAVTSDLIHFVPHFNLGTLLTTLGVVIARKLLRADYTWRLPPVAVWLLLLLAWIFAGLIWLPLIWITALQCHWLVYGVLYVLLVWELVRTPRDFRRVLLAAAAGCIFTTVSTLHELVVLFTRGPAALGADKLPQLVMLRFYGHWLGPNMLAHTLMPYAALLVALLRRNETRLVRGVALLALACTLISIGLTQSRAGILALFAALLVSFYPSEYRGRLLALTGILMVVFLLLVPFDITGRFGALLGGRNDFSLSYRGYALQAALEGGMDAFPFGGGFGAFARYSRVYLPFVFPILHAHNTYAHIFNENGLPGVLLLGAVFFHFLRAVWKPLPGEVRGSFACASRYALLGALLGFFVGCLFEHLLHIAQLWAFFGLLSVYPYLFTDAKT